MTCKCARYDAAGNKILPHDAMKLYYKTDKQSLDLVSRYMPFRLVVIPDVEIRFPVGRPDDCTVYKIYPGETKEFQTSLSERALDYMRKLYRRSSRWETKCSTPGWIVFHRKGRVILDPLKRYGVLRPSF